MMSWLTPRGGLARMPAGCAASYLVRHRPSLSGRALTIYQGAEIKRPSTLHCRAVLSTGEQNAAFGLEKDQIGAADGYVRVGGSTVLVAEGRFFLYLFAH